MTKITEVVLQEAATRVEEGVIKGAKLLGLNSRNKRRYESKALQNATALYEGKKVYVNHPDPDAGHERKFENWAGVIENVRYKKGDGLYGDVVLRQESAYFKGIIEAASNPKFSKSCGFSHVAEGESHYDDDTEIIESIKQVFSVDLVTDPATTAGFFESVQRETPSLREAIDTLPESPQRKQLIEMMGDYGIGGGMPAEDDKPTDPLGEISAMCRELIRMLGEALVAKSTPPPVAPPVPTNPEAEGDEVPPEDEEMTEEDKGKIEAFESLTRQNAELKASKLLLESGRQATEVRMKALANCATDEERQELLESWPKIESAGRPSRSPAATSDATDFPRDNPEKFAALLR